MFNAVRLRSVRMLARPRSSEKSPFQDVSECKSGEAGIYISFLLRDWHVQVRQLECEREGDEL